MADAFVVLAVKKRESERERERVAGTHVTCGQCTMWSERGVFKLPILARWATEDTRLHVQESPFVPNRAVHSIPTHISLFYP